MEFKKKSYSRKMWTAHLNADIFRQLQLTETHSSEKVKGSSLENSCLII